MPTKYRLTGTVKGERIATVGVFTSKEEAENAAYKQNWQHPGINARVVKDSPRTRRMVPKYLHHRME
jgi:hypothetical protein